MFNNSKRTALSFSCKLTHIAMTPAILHQNSQSTTTYNQHVSQFPHNRSNLLFATNFQRCKAFYVGFLVSKWANGTTKSQDIERGWFNVTGPQVNRNSFELEKTN